jgi:hypothetical protein
MGGYLLATTAVTALGRINMGLEQALSSRYQTPAMLFWWTVIAVLLTLPALRTPARLAAAPAAVSLSVMLLMTPGFQEILDQCVGRGALIRTAMLAIQMDVQDDQFLGGLYPDPSTPVAMSRYLWRRGLALPDSVPLRLLGAPVASVYSIPAKSSLAGRIETIRGAGRAVMVTGWAWDSRAGNSVTGVIFTNPAGVVIGTGLAGLPRPDIRAANWGVPALNSGWHGYARLSQLREEIRVYAVEAASAYPIGTFLPPAP